MRLVHHYIQEASSRISQSNYKLNDDEKSILQKLIERKEKYNINNEDIDAIMIDLIMAGVDTVNEKQN